jgi:hypothetical protein
MREKGKRREKKQSQERDIKEKGRKRGTWEGQGKRVIITGNAKEKFIFD